MKLQILSDLHLETERFHPQPAPTDQVSGATLNAITNYYDEALRRELGAVIPIATEPGPTTLRFQPAITAAAPRHPQCSR